MESAHSFPLNLKMIIRGSNSKIIPQCNSIQNRPSQMYSL